MKMNLSNQERAEILVQALPNLKHYHGKTVVIKYGGNAMTSELLKEEVMEDIVLLSMVGIRVVLVHGGGPEISDLMKRLGKKPEFIDGLRVTDEETVDIVQMVLAGKVNKSLVNLLQAKGGLAIGISGMDARIIEADFSDPKYGYVGRITNVNTKPVADLIDAGYIPVISTLGCDRLGHTFNINGDTVAGKIASSIHAERLIMMTDIPGIMKDPSDPDSLIEHLTTDEADVLMTQDIVSGGMIPKVQCCVSAVRDGVQAAVILDGTVEHSILMELLTDEGAGTLIERG